MKPVRLKIAEQDLVELERLVFADRPKEAAAFALAGKAEHASATDVLVRRPVAIPAGEFRFQSEFHLELSTQAVNGLAALCEANRLGAVLCHSHPQDIPYSTSDDYGETRVFEVLRNFLPEGAPTASLLFCPGGVHGRIWIAGRREPVPLDEILVLGRRLRRIGQDPPPSPIFRS